MRALLALAFVTSVSSTALAQETAGVIRASRSSRVPSAVSYLDRGNDWFRRGDFGRAIADYSDFDQAIKLAPRLAEGWNNRVVTLLRLGRLRDAEADIARLRELGGRLKPEAEQLWREVKERLAKK